MLHLIGFSDVYVSLLSLFQNIVLEIFEYLTVLFGCGNLYFYMTREYLYANYPKDINAASLPWKL